MEFIYQSKEYKSGRYNENILHALKERKRIYDILMRFKTQDSTEQERNSFYPITLYCENCRKDDTTIESFDEERGEIEYGCKCGNSGIGDQNSNLPKFGQMAGIFPLVNFDINILQHVLKESGEDCPIDKIKILSDRIYHWINEWNQEKSISIRTVKDNEYYEGLSQKEKEWLAGVCNLIENSENQDDISLMKDLYDVCHDDDKKIKKANQKRLFSIVYKLVLNSDSGPRLPLLIKTVGIEGCLNLLKF